MKLPGTMLIVLFFVALLVVGHEMLVAWPIGLALLVFFLVASVLLPPLMFAASPDFEWSPKPRYVAITSLCILSTAIPFSLVFGIRESLAIGLSLASMPLSLYYWNLYVFKRHQKTV
jgi:hypothetical protein